MLLIIYLALHIKFMLVYMNLSAFCTFTNQTLLLDLCSITLTYLVSRKKTPLKKNTAFLALHHLLFEVVCANNILMLTAYWSVLHTETMKEFAADQIMKTHYCLVHSLPALAVVANFVLSDVVLKTEHSFLLIPLGLFFGFLNYCACAIQGKPLYFFLTWQDWTSPMLVLGLTLYISMMFYLLSVITWKIKRGLNWEGPIASRTRSSK